MTFYSQGKGHKAKAGRNRSKECTDQMCTDQRNVQWNVDRSRCAFQQNIVHLTFLYRSQSCTIYILQHIVHSNRALYISCTCHIPVHFTFYSTLCIPTETDHRKRGQIKGMYNVHRCAQIKGLCTSARPP
jgi:hypothetical protein